MMGIQLIKNWNNSMAKKETDLKGITASPGIVEGKVLIIKNPAKPVEPKRGCIIVTTFTTPVIALALTEAAGIICEKGGLTCHAAIIAREFNIPCIVGVKNTLKRLKNNQTIILDANKGKIYEA